MQRNKNAVQESESFVFFPLITTPPLFFTLPPLPQRPDLKRFFICSVEEVYDRDDKGVEWQQEGR